jgi:hypothetical protein
MKRSAKHSIEVSTPVFRVGRAIGRKHRLWRVGISLMRFAVLRQCCQARCNNIDNLSITYR